jgi:hypothetical protein
LRRSILGVVGNRSHLPNAARDDILPADADGSGAEVQATRSSRIGSATAAARWAVVASVVVLAGAAGGGWGLAFGGGKLTVVGAMIGVAAVVVCAGCVVWARRGGTEVRFLRAGDGGPLPRWLWDPKSAGRRPPGR